MELMACAVCILHGGKDHTKFTTRIERVGIGDKFWNNIISLIEEPGSQYIGHTTPASGSAENITDSVVSFVKRVILNNLVAVGCDGTNVNTGSLGCTIALTEKELHKPLQWLVCQLHANERPLRDLLKHLDGETSGPRA